MNEVYRAESIINCFRAIRKLGVATVVDFTVRAGVPNEMIVHLAIAVMMREQDKWVMGLPVCEKHDDPPPSIDALTCVRLPVEPVLGEIEQGDVVEEELYLEPELYV